MMGIETPWRKANMTKAAWILRLVNGGGLKLFSPVRDMLIHGATLGYDECPDYKGLTRNFKEYARNEGIELDGKMDWDKLVIATENGIQIDEEGIKKKSRWRKRGRARQKRTKGFGRKRRMKKARRIARRRRATRRRRIARGRH
jgi:hypothetical protein